MNWRFWKKCKKALKKDCLCEVLRPMLTISRWFCLLPIKWTHLKDQKDPNDDGLCHFSLSFLYIVFGIITFYSYFLEFNNFVVKYDDVLELLAMLNQGIYAFLSVVLLCYGIFRAKRMAVTLNGIAKLMQRGLMCESSYLCLKKKIKIGKHIVNCQFAAQILGFILIMYFNIYTDVHMDKYNNIFMRTSASFSHYVFFLFYYLSCSVCLIYVHLFACFESTLIQRISEISNSPVATGKIFN